MLGSAYTRDRAGPVPDCTAPGHNRSSEHLSCHKNWFPALAPLSHSLQELQLTAIWPSTSPKHCEHQEGFQQNQLCVWEGAFLIAEVVQRALVAFNYALLSSLAVSLRDLE